MFSLGSAVVQKQTLGATEHKWSFDGQLCLKYSYQKLLKSDHPCLSYDFRYNIGVFLCLTVYIENADAKHFTPTCRFNSKINKTNERPNHDLNVTRNTIAKKETSSFKWISNDHIVEEQISNSALKAA